MLFLGIDQHARQLTISLRSDGGDVVMARQVSTQPDKINDFFQRLTCERLRDGLTRTASGISRRNVSGAIAHEKNDCNFPLRRQLS